MNRERNRQEAKSTIALYRCELHLYAAVGQRRKSGMLLKGGLWVGGSCLPFGRQDLLTPVQTFQAQGKQ